ncbi:MAG: hypothetical protein LBF78_12845 [Treponema sp.]|jgi:5-formyltetrahydrofolate cyclo-ligase|nr:hypothetical protein [Treponema sp.]
MKLEKSIVVHMNDEAKRSWEAKEARKKGKKFSCPSCETEELKKSAGNETAEKEKKQ